MQADLASKRARYESASMAAPDALPEVLDDPSLREYQSKITELKRQLAELSSLLTPENYKVERIRAQIAQMEALYQRQRANILARIQVEYEVGRRKEKMLADAYAAQINTVHADEVSGIQYDVLRREADANRQLYDSLLQKIGEAGVASAIKESSLRVIDAAEPPIRPKKPNVPVSVFLGMTGGLFLAMGLVWVVEAADNTLKWPGEGTWYLNVPELGSIPAIEVDPGYSDFKKSCRIPGRESLLNLSRTGAVSDLALWHTQRSLFSESFRAAAISLLLSRGNDLGSHVILITSTMPKEGKSTVTTNLGIALAKINRRTLLIDGDTRRPRLHYLFGLDGKPGLSELLLGTDDILDLPLEKLAYQTDAPNLFVIPSGRTADDSSDFLHSQRMASLLRRCRRDFDNIIIDSPPMSQIPDARALGRLTDGVVLLVRAGATPRETAQAGIERLAQDGTPVLGSILNYWNPAKHTIISYYDYYRGQGTSS